MTTAQAGTGIRRPAPPLIVLVPALAVGAGMLVPLLYLVLRALEADPATVAALVLRWRTLDLLLNTAALAGGVLALTTVIALPLAWLSVRVRVPGRRLLDVLVTLPLAVPGYVMAFALIGLSGHYGFMNQVFGVMLPRLEGWLGATLALSLYTYPYLFLNLRAALAGMDASLEESARSLGCTPLEVFRRVTLPHLRPALFAGWLVIGLYTVGDFGAVALMRYEVFSYAIYTQYSGAFDRIYAAWLALILVVVAMVFVWLEGRIRDARRYARTGTGAGRRPEPVDPGIWRWPAFVFVVLVVAAALGLPAAVLAFWLGRGEFVSMIPALLAAFGHSLSAAVPAALLAGALALPVAVLAVRYPSPLARVIDRVAFVGYAIPPLAFALAMVFLSLRSVPFLYQTLALLVLAYALSFLALALGPVRAALYQTRPSLEESARALGHGPLQVFMHVQLPLLRRGVIAGVLLVFVIAMKDLPIAFLLAPTGFRSLAIGLFSRTSEGMLIEAAPFAAAIVVFSGMFVGIVLRHETKRD